MTTLLITLSGAIIAFITFDKELTATDLAPAFLLLFLGVFGVLFSAKHYERLNFHISRVRVYRKALEQSFPDVSWKKSSRRSRRIPRSPIPDARATPAACSLVRASWYNRRSRFNSYGSNPL
jgi:hypothetical protein